MGISTTPAPDSGAFGSNATQGYGTGHFLTQTLATTAAFVEQKFGFQASTVRIDNTGAQSAEISFDGVNVHHVLASSSQYVWERIKAGSIWVRHPTSTTNLDMEAY